MQLGEERRRAVCGRTARTVRGGGGRHQGSVGNAVRPECLPPTLHNVRRQSGKLLIKPSKAAQRRIRERLRTEMRSLRGANARAVIKRLNPIIRGWAAYYRGVVSSEVFSALDAYEWKLAYKWARYTHPNKPASWGHRPVLRPVQQVQERPVGVRRPRQRRLPPQVRLDQDRPTPNGQRRGVPGRPRPGRLLGQATEQGATPVD